MQEEHQGSLHNSKRPENVKVHSRGTSCFCAFDCHGDHRLHFTVAHVTSLWESLEESHEPVSQLRRKPDTACSLRGPVDVHHLLRQYKHPVETPEVPKIMSALEKYPQLPASAPDEDLGPTTRLERNCERPLQLAWRLTST